MLDSVPLFVARPGKIVGQFHLVLTEDIDVEMPAAFEGLKAVDLCVNAKQHQRWVKRQRRKRVRGDADLSTVMVERCNNSNTGRKTSNCVAIFSLINCRKTFRYLSVLAAFTGGTEILID